MPKHTGCALSKDMFILSYQYKLQVQRVQHAKAIVGHRLMHAKSVLQMIRLMHCLMQNAGMQHSMNAIWT